jgi:hypothetical protein
LTVASSRRVAVTTLAALLAAAAGAADPESWTPLFNGRTLDGWTGEHTDRYAVKGAAIVAGGGPGWLRYNRPLRDFELHAEYRQREKDSAGGLLFRARAESTAKNPHWPARGYQLQLGEGRNCFAFVGLGVAPPRFDRKPSVLKDALKPSGEWQSIRLRVVGTRALAALNGETITVSDSIALGEGSIGLRCGDGRLEWRDLKIKEFSAP